MNGASVADAKEFEPRSDGGFEHIKPFGNGCQWRVTGREVVTTMRRIRLLQEDSGGTTVQ